jgi:2-polyprenyl-3-methyl-5-hydroxy-6-metoxy-1,4-benzoquinol methylase
MIGIENVYKKHHQNRADGFAILTKERGSFLQKHIGKGKTVLDIGCRDGKLTSQYSEGNDVTGSDIDKDALDRASKNFGIITIQTDLNAEWPFEENFFDVVVACEFLEHIYFPEVVFEKVIKVLKKEGIFIGTIPHAYSLQSRIKFLLGIKSGTPLEDPTHINHFIYSVFKKNLEKHFDIVEVIGHTPKRYRWISKFFPFLFSNDILFCCKNK